VRRASSNRRQSLTRSGPRGYSLIELLVVVSMLAIIAGIALPQINVTAIRMDAGARLVRSSLQLAERLAITRQHNVLVSFDYAKNRLRIVEDSSNNERADAAERVTWKYLEEGARFALPPAGLTGTVTSQVVGTRVKTIDGMPSVIFRRNGVASTELEIYLSSVRAKPGDARAIAVTQSTGRADWFRYVDKNWKSGGL
jgi:prepilin-type N-terminal cleavage/methylation domain-containing protein